VFGVPGTQNVDLYEAIRRSTLRSVLTTHELGAAFMANGYARASGKLGVVVAIPGPGFAYTLAGLAEAKLDSVPLLLITGEPARRPEGRVFYHQAIDQPAIARPLVKEVIEVGRAADVQAAVTRACELALHGEPGPVVLQVSETAMAEPAEAAPRPVATSMGSDAAQLDAIVARFMGARRPVILAGQGAAGAAAALRRLVDRWSVPVVTTPAGRGVLPEDHPLALGFDQASGNVAVLNKLLQRADCVLAVGCKLSESGSVGFALQLPADRLIHVDTASHVLAANHPAALTACARAEDVFERLASVLCGQTTERDTAWSGAEVSAWRMRLRTAGKDRFPEPRFPGLLQGTAAAFFSALRRAVADDAILVTDSGLHQSLARLHFEVRAPRGLIVPNDFQAMGYGVPAAIGAKLAAPARPVVAIIGDGGLVMAGMELLTAAREGIPVVVVVFNDGKLNQIRVQQLAAVGHAHDVTLRTPNLAAFAQALGIGYARLSGDPEPALRAAVAARGPTLIEAVVGDSPAIRTLQVRGLARHTARRALGPAVTAWIKRRLNDIRALRSSRGPAAPPP
jgi:acetolactate synthase-1/2/3 large subunit